jgi:hypothetical protein
VRVIEDDVRLLNNAWPAGGVSCRLLIGGGASSDDCTCGALRVSGGIVNDAGRAGASDRGAGIGGGGSNSKSTSVLCSDSAVSTISITSTSGEGVLIFLRAFAVSSGYDFSTALKFSLVRTISSKTIGPLS